LQSAIELRTLFESKRVFVFDCQRTVIEFGRRSVDPFRILDFATNSLSDRVGQSRWSNTLAQKVQNVVTRSTALRGARENDLRAGEWMRKNKNHDKQ
jgi:hypothetical protein